MPLTYNAMSKDMYPVVVDNPDIGQGEETLKDWGLTQKKVIQAAERTQDRAREFNPKGLAGIDGIFHRAIEAADGDGEKFRDALLYFNIPVCDLDHDSVKDEIPDDLDCGQYIGRQACMVTQIAKFCMGMKIDGSDSEWPYAWDGDGEWSD